MQKVSVKQQVKVEGKVKTVSPEPVKKEYHTVIKGDFSDYDPEGGSEVDIHVTAINPKGVGYFALRLDIIPSAISCGVCQICNISSLNGIIAKLKTVENKKEIVKNIILDVIKETKRISSFALISNNDKTPFINEILDEIANSYTQYRTNKNSGNNIKVWII